MSVSVWSVQI